MAIVTVTAFQYKPLARFRAFATMGRVLMKPFTAEGLLFSKLMGSGINFGLVPDLSTYVFLAVWNDEASASAFPLSEIYLRLNQGTQQTGTLFLRPQRAHGLWDGQNPFHVLKGEQPVIEQPVSPMAVLTRATIRPRALPNFWRHVPRARQHLTNSADDLLFGIGVGEVPVFQQCTISVWRNPAAVDRYAYRQSGHREVVRLTREQKWYTEELFARFSVLRAEGTLFESVQRLIY